MSLLFVCIALASSFAQEQPRRPRLLFGYTIDGAATLVLLRSQVRQAELTIEAAIDESGQMDDFKVVNSTADAFKEVVLATSKAWRFEPAQTSGRYPYTFKFDIYEAAPSTLEGFVIYGNDPKYPPDLVVAGVQGMTTLRAKLNADGMLEQLAVYESSRSPQLDELALSLAARRRFERPVGAPSVSTQSELSVGLSVQLFKDTQQTLPNKTCTDLNADVAYFRAAFPEDHPQKLGAFVLVIQAITRKYTQNLTDKLFTNPGQQKAMNELMVVSERFKGVVEKTVAGCAAAPKRKFLDVMQKADGDLAIKSAF